MVEDEFELVPKLSKSVDLLRARFLKELGDTYDIENAPVNDRANVEHLAALMVQRQVLDAEMLDLMSRVTDHGTKEQDLERFGKRLEEISKMVDRVGRQIEAREKALQIGPKERAAAQGAVQGHDVIQELVEQTMELRRDVVVHIQDGYVLLGHIFWHFPEHLPECAACGGQEFKVMSPNGVEVAVHFTTPTARRLYARAADFLPFDAPSIDLFVATDQFASRNGSEDQNPL
jgi:hypothetical protein